ncbi:MAG: hypothetical protein H6546_01380 [Chitinophagales bacterium]|nr:hypothetical protein [Chitinophagales bacterium]
MPNWTIETGKFLKSIERVKVMQNVGGYKYSYPVFMEYFNNIHLFKKDDLILGINLVYAWMPTILWRGDKMPTDHQMNQAVEVVGKVFQNRHKSSHKLLSKGEIDLLKNVVNNSVVGTSKLLHFVAPGQYPIWDSRVHLFLKKITGARIGLGSTVQYLHYVNQVQILKGRLKENLDWTKFKNNHGLNDVQEIRAIEQAMFWAIKGQS